jgi:hypothetical protein
MTEVKRRTMLDNARYEELQRMRHPLTWHYEYDRAAEILSSSDIAKEVIRRRGYNPADVEEETNRRYFKELPGTS